MISKNPSFRPMGPKQDFVIVICGSRNFKNKNLMREVIKGTTNSIHGNVIIRTGEFTKTYNNANRYAIEIANELGLKYEIIEAQWKKFACKKHKIINHFCKGWKNPAGKIRNIQMLEKKTIPKRVYGFYAGVISWGTWHTLKEAKKRRITTEEFGLNG